MRHRRRSLLDRLLATAVPDRGKASRWELLTDCLEFVAVAEGLKPAHLHGNGMRSQRVLDAFRKIAALHQLETIETCQLPPPFPREAGPDSRILTKRYGDKLTANSEEPSVLWVFRDDALRETIAQFTQTREGLAAVVGYPECCARDHDDKILDMEEELLRGLREQHGAESDTDFERLFREDARVESDLMADHMAQHMESRRRFPFIQFVACRSCLSGKRSPAARLHEEMRSLAMRLGRDFHDSILEAFEAEYEREQ